MTISVGVIGVGLIGQDHIRRITEVLSGAVVTAVTDIDAGLAATVAAKVGATVYPDANSLIAARSVDAVLVASYGPAHEAAVLACIAQRKPVFCEKPLTPKADAALRIIEAEVATGHRLVQVGFMRRYDRSYRAMKATLDSGDLGQALMVHNAHRNASVADRYTADMAINDTAIHEFDAMRWLLGEEIVQVRVDHTKRTSVRSDDLQDPLVVVATTASGVRISDEVFVNCQYGYDIRCEVVAERGAVSLADNAPIDLRGPIGAHHPIPLDWRERFVDAYDQELREWIGSVAANSVTGPSAWDGYAVAEVCDAAVKSLFGQGQLEPVNLAQKPALYS